MSSAEQTTIKWISKLQILEKVVSYEPLVEKQSTDKILQGF